MTNKGTIYTIGYAGYPDRNDFIADLIQNKINVVIDVRSNPHSQYWTQYDKENIAPELKKHGIYYRSYAHEFGARPPELFFYLEGYMNFEQFAQSSRFQTGFEKMKNTIEQGFRPVLMCAEKYPIECHRGIMLGREFFNAGYNVYHIISNGEIKQQQMLELELLDRFFPNRDQLSFHEDSIKDRRRQVAEAYRKQNLEIGAKMDIEAEARKQNILLK